MDAFLRLKDLPLGEPVAPDDYTFAAVVSAAAVLHAMRSGMANHAQVVKSEFDSSVFVGNTLISMYFANDKPESGRVLFGSLPEKDVIMWTEMVAGHTLRAEGELVLKYLACFRKGTGLTASL
jgi:hypothetical protein